MEWKVKSDRAVYLQIIDYIRMQIFSGEIGSGDKLLSVRTLKCIECKPQYCPKGVCGA